MSPDKRHYKCYDEEECFAAIRGKNKYLVPWGRPPHISAQSAVSVTTLALLRSYTAKAKSIRSLCALKARSIMSGIVSDMNELHEFPYCIWHPDIAIEATYRELARRYP